MIVIDNTCVSDDIVEKFFICDLQKCKGACCVEGDAGAPLLESEIAILDDIYPYVKPYLSEKSVATIEKKGLYEIDDDGEYVTTIIDGADCVFVIYDDKNIAKCGIEKAYYDKKIDFKKPISCHLYPIRISTTNGFDSLNYERWTICSPACELGNQWQVPIYKFLQEPLVRKYGEAWYAQLCGLIENKQNN